MSHRHLCRLDEVFHDIQADAARIVDHGAEIDTLQLDVPRRAGGGHALGGHGQDLRGLSGRLLRQAGGRLILSAAVPVNARIQAPGPPEFIGAERAVIVRQPPGWSQLAVDVQSVVGGVRDEDRQVVCLELEQGRVLVDRAGTGTPLGEERVRRGQAGGRAHGHDGVGGRELRVLDVALRCREVILLARARQLRGRTLGEIHDRRVHLGRHLDLDRCRAGGVQGQARSRAFESDTGDPRPEILRGAVPVPAVGDADSLAVETDAAAARLKQREGVL